MVCQASSVPGEVGAMTRPKQSSKRRQMYSDEQPCGMCGGPMKGSTVCAKCYRKTEAGRLERFVHEVMTRYKREAEADGGSCRTCLHWCGYCDLGLPEAATPIAIDCPAKYEVL